MMRFSVSCIIPVVLVLGVVASSGGWAAFRLSDTQNVEEQIAAVRERLEQVRPLVEESRNERAMELLEQAARFLADAERAWQEREDERLALNYVRRALELTGAAVQEATRNQGIEQEQVERELVRLRETLRAAQEMVEQTDLAPAHNLLRQAEQEAEWAREFFEQRAYIQALERIRRATELALQARSQASQWASSSEYQERFGQVLEELDGLIEEARQSPVDSALGINIGELVSSAERLRERAQQSYEQGRFGQALDLARRSRELLRWALRAVSQPLIDGDVAGRAARELERARALLAEAREALGNAANAEQTARLAQVEAWIGQAEQALDEGQAALAMDLLRQAIDLAMKLIYEASGGGTASFPDLAEAARSEYARLVNDILPGALEQVQQHPNPRAVYYLEQAQAAAERARQYLEQEQFERALQEINAAITLARRAIEESHRGASL